VARRDALKLIFQETRFAADFFEFGGSDRVYGRQQLISEPEHLPLNDPEKDVRQEQANRTVRELAFASALELGSTSRRG
jgi:hypothetical protein